MLGVGTLPYAPQIIIDEAARLLFDQRRPVPWISYNATNYLGKLVQPSWRVLEFGSGMSTIWFSKRVASVVSVESNLVWYQRVTSLLRGQANVRVLLRAAECAEYADLSEWPDGFFDLMLVDGDCRRECIERGCPKVRSGGYVYLDNIDKDAECRAAAAVLDIQMQNRQGVCKDYTDFAPGLFAATSGRLVRFSGGLPPRS
jgi:predicted O-methyltransferase YrrM